jgi:uncharacterized Tic20 family protein
MSQPNDDERPPFAPPEGRPADDDRGAFAPPEGQADDERRPPPHRSLYGQPPGTPPPPYGRQDGGPAPQQPPHGRPPYDPRWGYGPPGNPGQPNTQATGDDTTWAIFCYIGTIILGFLAPLIIYFVKRGDSAFVRHHAAQSLNYQLTVFLQIMISLAVAVPFLIATQNPAWLVIFAPVFLVHLVAQYVFLILGSIRSGRGELYRMPTWTCWRMIR